MAASYTISNSIPIWNYLVICVDICSMIKIIDVGKKSNELLTQYPSLSMSQVSLLHKTKKHVEPAPRSFCAWLNASKHDAKSNNGLYELIRIYFHLAGSSSLCKVQSLFPSIPKWTKKGSVGVLCYNRHSFGTYFPFSLSYSHFFEALQLSPQALL